MFQNKILSPALFLAVRQGWLSLVNLLLTFSLKTPHKLDLSLTDRDGQTVWHAAVQRGIDEADCDSLNYRTEFSLSNLNNKKSN